MQAYKLQSETDGFPNYGNPPVIETILGVQFQPIPGLTNAHLGAFWGSMDRDEWPKVQDATPLPRQDERFHPEAAWGKSLQLLLTQSPISRLQIRNRNENRMVQVQNGRLHLNWLGTHDEHYPRYQTIRDEFESHFRHLIGFVEENELGSLEPDHWEISYLNRIDKGVWQTPGDWSFFRPLNGVPTISGLIEGESFSGEWHFVIPPEMGRLHIHWQHARDSVSAETSHVQLTLTARGEVKADAGPCRIDRMLDGLDLGRATIVRTFRELMSESANKVWKLDDDRRN